jgi:hypothetical protein
MKVEELSLVGIGAHLIKDPVTVNRMVVAAVAWAARRGWGNHTAYLFLTALVMTDTLRHQDQWPVVMRKLQDLKYEKELAELEVGMTVEGEIEGS